MATRPITTTLQKCNAVIPHRRPRSPALGSHRPRADRGRSAAAAILPLSPQPPAADGGQAGPSAPDGRGRNGCAVPCEHAQGSVMAAGRGAREGGNEAGQQLSRCNFGRR